MFNANYYPGNVIAYLGNILKDVDVILTSDGKLDVTLMIQNYLTKSLK